MRRWRTLKPEVIDRQRYPSGSLDRSRGRNRYPILTIIQVDHIDGAHARHRRHPASAGRDDELTMLGRRRESQQFDPCGTQGSLRIVR